MTIFEILLFGFLLLIILFLAVQFYNIIFRSYAPFISTRRKVLQRIVEELKTADSCTIYELGCGDAGFLRLARQKFPGAKLIGIEYSILPYIIAQVQSSLSGSKIKFIKKNFFKVDFKDADIIYCFLNITSMARLEPKLKAECKPGALFISYHFTLPGHSPEKVLEMKNKDKIYFYRL
jgi:SAM-dependent methyltransferase